jgi:beta-N-acetylglucosaminidase
MDIADSLSNKQRDKFLELTEKVNLLNSNSYSYLDLIEYQSVLNEINKLYDGKIDYIKKALDFIRKNEKNKISAELLVNEFIK